MSSGLFYSGRRRWGVVPACFILSLCWRALLAGPSCSFYSLFLSLSLYLVVCLALMSIAPGWFHVELDLSPPAHQAWWKCLCPVVVVVVVPVVGFPPVRFASLRAQVPVSEVVSGPVCLVGFLLSVYLLPPALSKSGGGGGGASTSSCLCLCLAAVCVCCCLGVGLLTIILRLSTCGKVIGCRDKLYFHGRCVQGC